MRRAMWKPRVMPSKIFETRLAELKKCLLAFPGLDKSNKMDEAGIN